MRGTTIAVAAALMLGMAGSALAEEAAGRYTMTPTENGYLRLDTATGAVSLCREESGTFACNPVADTSSAMTVEIERLKAENEALHDELERMRAAVDTGATPGSGLPSDAEVDRAMGFVEKLMRRFKSLIEELKKEEQPATPLESTPERDEIGTSRLWGGTPRLREPTGEEEEMALAIRQIRDELSFHPQGRSLTDITPEIVTWLNGIGAREGLLTIFLKHTSASLAIQENTDPDVQRDILDALDRLAPEGAGYRHRCEGADDMPAHIKAMLTPVSLSIPVVEGALALGTWQAVYLLEHRRQTHRRTVVVHFLGAAGSQHH